jgi:hypothetical protein
MAKKMIAMTLDVEVVEELNRLRAVTDVPVSRIANRVLAGALLNHSPEKAAS